MRVHANFRRRAAVAVLGALPLLMTATRAHADAAAPTEATDAEREAAQSHYAAGRKLYAAGDHAGALAAFLKSLDVVASPNTRLYVARCQRELGKPVLAYAEFARASSDAKGLAAADPRYAKAAQAADEERAALATRLGFVRLNVEHAEPTTTVRLGGEPLAAKAWAEPLPTAPGKVSFSVETEGREPQAQTVEVAAGETKAVTLDAHAAALVSSKMSAAPAPAPEPRADPSGPRRVPVAAFITGGVAVVGIGTFTAFGLMASATHSDLEQGCGAGPCGPSRQSDVDTGRSQQLIANVGLGVFILGAAATTAIVLLRPKSAPQRGQTRAPAAATLHVSPFGLSGAF